MTTAIKENLIYPDASKVGVRLIDQSTGKEHFFYRGNSVKFRVIPKLNGEDIDLGEGGSVNLQIKSSSNPNSTLFVSKTTSFYPPVFELSKDESANIPVGQQHLLIWWIDANQNRLTLYAEKMTVLEDGSNDELEELVFQPELFLKKSYANIANGYASLDKNAKISIAQLPDGVINESFITIDIANVSQYYKNPKVNDLVARNASSKDSNDIIQADTKTPIKDLVGFVTDVRKVLVKEGPATTIELTVAIGGAKIFDFYPLTPPTDIKFLNYFLYKPDGALTGKYVFGVSNDSKSFTGKDDISNIIELSSVARSFPIINGSGLIDNTKSIVQFRFF